MGHARSAGATGCRPGPGFELNVSRSGFVTGPQPLNLCYRRRSDPETPGSSFVGEPLPVPGVSSGHLGLRIWLLVTRAGLRPWEAEWLDRMNPPEAIKTWTG